MYVRAKNANVGQLGDIYGEIIIAAVPALISLASSAFHHNDPPPPPPCTFWQRLVQLFGGHPPCSD